MKTITLSLAILLSGCASLATHHDMQRIEACSVACSRGGMQSAFGCHCTGGEG